MKSIYIYIYIYIYICICNLEHKEYLQVYLNMLYHYYTIIFYVQYTNI